MLHIVLLILKIIGIILLCIIGVIILSLFCVLFVPVRYRIEITREEGENQPPVIVRVKVTWLLHLLNILIRYPAEIMVRVRFAIFTILKMPAQKASGEQGKGAESRAKKKKAKGKNADKNKIEGKTEEKTEAKNRAEENKEKGKQAEENKEEGTQVEENKEKVSKKEKNQEVAKETKEKIPTVTIQATKIEDAENLEKSEEKLEKQPSLMEKLRALPDILRKLFEKIKSLFENIQYTIRRLCDKIKSISDNIQYYKAVVESDVFQHSFGLCKEELVAILKSLKPQKFTAKLIIGLDDPAATGQILAVFGILYPVFGGQVDVTGDFERKRIEGRVFVKGRIRFFTFLHAAVRIYFNKDIRRLLKLLKKEAA